MKDNGFMSNLKRGMNVDTFLMATCFFKKFL